MTTKYALIITGNQVTGQRGSIMTEEGQKFWVLDGEWGPTTSRFIDKEHMPGKILTWDILKNAEEFANTWGGHPWWCEPSGVYEIIQVKPKIVEVKDGWEVI